MQLKVINQVKNVQIKMFTAANPTDPSICLFTALGIYCSYESVSLIAREGIFMKDNAKLGTAVDRFYNSLQKIIENYAEVVDGYLCSSHVS